MLLKALFLLTTVLTIVYAEPPPAVGFHRRAPYPAAGWRPDVPFNLPREYLPPGSATAEPQRFRPNIELSKERIEYVGQLEMRMPHTTYATPQLDLPNEQQLPNSEPADFFNQNQNQIGEKQTAEAQRHPAEQYGPPANSGFRIFYPEADGNVEPPAAAEPLRQRDIKEGRYYIVSPDKKLQRVIYRTTKNSEEASGEGFTAQLRYSTVGELQDPIYRYNEEGQLVRVLK